MEWRSLVVGMQSMQPRLVIPDMFFLVDGCCTICVVFIPVVAEVHIHP